jgi:NitT/TauT family transport system permease protein
MIVWEIYAKTTTMGVNYAPPLEYIFYQTFIQFRGQIITGIITTGLEIVVGYFLAAVVGITIGTVLSQSFLLRQFSLPVLIFSYSIPHAIIAPIFFIWFGAGVQTVIAFVVWTSFFYIFVSTLTGMASVDKEFRQLSNLLQASRWQRISKIEFWAALPYITTGLKISAQSAVIAAIIAEFVSGSSGLGHLIAIQVERVFTGLMFGSVIILTVLAVAWYRFIEYLIDLLIPGPTENK